VSGCCGHIVHYITKEDSVEQTALNADLSTRRQKESLLASLVYERVFPGDRVIVW